MALTALITADLHLSDNPRDEYRFSALAFIRNLAKERKVSHVIVLGDLTEEKGKHGARLVNRIVNEFDKLASVCDVTILRGNHDYLIEDHPFFAFLNRIPGISFINNPTEFPVDGLGHCLFLPHTRDWQKDWEGIELTGNDWVFAHNTFGGANVGARTLTGVPTKMFGKDKDYVIAGDVHVPQQLGPVTYVGAPCLVDFGDDYEPRALLIEEGKKPKSIPIEGPQKRLIEVVEDEIGALVEANRGDLIKVRVHIDPSRHANWAEIRDEARKAYKELGLTVYSIHPIVARERTKPVQRKARPLDDDISILKQYAKARTLDSKTLSTGLVLLEKV